MMAPKDATATDTAAKRATTYDDPPLVSFISLLDTHGGASEDGETCTAMPSDARDAF